MFTVPRLGAWEAGRTRFRSQAIADARRGDLGILARHAGSLPWSVMVSHVLVGNRHPRWAAQTERPSGLAAGAGVLGQLVPAVHVLAVDVPHRLRVLTRGASAASSRLEVVPQIPR